MMKRILFACTFGCISFLLNAQTGNVGIGTNNPVARLHVADSNVLFKGPAAVYFPPGLPPASGPGVRMMWYPNKASFRSGFVDGAQWDEDSIGYYSFAGGWNTMAKGTVSTAFGMNTKAEGYGSFVWGHNSTATGIYSIALGENNQSTEAHSQSYGISNISSADNSIAIGRGITASGYNSTGIGTNSIASQFQSIVFGNGCNALGSSSVSIGNNSNSIGNYSTVIGFGSESKVYGGISIGAFNNNSDEITNGQIPSDRIFQIGNGSGFSSRANALTILRNGNIGIGGSLNPGFKLNFDDNLGDKISLLGQSGNHYGFGIANNLLQIHSSVAGSDIAFGYGQSISFIERMRVKGNGNVGIGTTTPGFKLSFDDNTGDKISLWGQSGNHYGFGVAPNTLQIHADISSSDIAFGYGSSATLTQTMRIKGNGQVLIDPSDLNTGNLTAGAILFGAPGSGEGIAVKRNAGTYQWGIQFFTNGISRMVVKSGGGVDVSGAICASAFNACSDIRFKTNFSSINNALQSVLTLNGIYYDWKTTEFPDKHFSNARQLGFSAQEIEKLFPEIVQTDAEGYKSVDYARLTPVLVEAVKEQQIIIDKQSQKMQSLENKLEQQQTELDEIKLLLKTLKNNSK